MPVGLFAGSTQEEVSSIVQASIADSRISGGDRPVAWDGATTSGDELRNQLRAIAVRAHPVVPPRAS